MRWLPTLTALLPAALALAACASAAREAPRPDYYVMRHLQKEAGQDPGLSAEGRHAAERLAELLRGDPPSAIYVSNTRRAHETAAPLAARLHVAVKEYPATDLDGLVARVRAEPGTVLIVGHSNTVPEIVARLGGISPGPIADDRFGDVWHIWGSPPRTEALRVAP
jgi:broad specificity phosphatase PhoE